MLFTCIKSWFFRNHLANFHQISHWSFCWNVIDSLFKWSCSIDCQAHIFFFKTKNCSNDVFSLVAMIGLEKMLHNICMLQWLCHSGEPSMARGPLVILYHRHRDQADTRWTRWHSWHKGTTFTDHFCLAGRCFRLGKYCLPSASQSVHKG